MRLICKSRVYQHSIETSKWNDGDEIKVTTPVGPRRFELLKVITIHDEE